MVGKYTLNISNNKLEYNIEINRAITVIRGNSGTGKTTLYELIRFMNNGGKGIKCNLKEMVIALENSTDWNKIIKESKNKIFFADENIRYVYTDEFANIIQSSDNYFVVVTRRKLSNYTYSYKSVYKLVSKNSGDKLYTELECKFKNNISNNKIIRPDIVLCEDSNSGYDMIKDIVTGCKVETAFGKDNIERILKDNKDKLYYIIADGAGFGNCITAILNLINLDYKFTIILEESFEYMILTFDNFSKYSKFINNPQEYCDSKKFKSYERYYTWLLNEILVKNFNETYTKSKLPKKLRNRKIYKHISSMLKILDRDFIKEEYR